MTRNTVRLGRDHVDILLATPTTLQCRAFLLLNISLGSVACSRLDFRGEPRRGREHITYGMESPKNSETPWLTAAGSKSSRGPHEHECPIESHDGGEQS
jgi:hypothetical protein